MQHKWISGKTRWKNVQMHNTQYKLQFFIIRFNRHGEVFINVSKCLLHMSRLFWLWPSYRGLQRKLQQRTALVQAEFSEMWTLRGGPLIWLLQRPPTLHPALSLIFLPEHIFPTRALHKLADSSFLLFHPWLPVPRHSSGNKGWSHAPSPTRTPHYQCLSLGTPAASPSSAHDPSMCLASSFWPFYSLFFLLLLLNAETLWETCDILGFHDIIPDQVLVSSHLIWYLSTAQVGHECKGVFKGRVI